jgi:hypothetical protein
MPITFSYSDPEPLGEYAYYAAGRRQRRENLDRSIDRQLQADRANASLALNYEQLYGNLAQRELDRQIGLAESAADRNFRRDQQAAAQSYATDQANTAHRRDLEILDARQAAELRGDDARRQRDLDRANGVIAQLKKEKTNGLWLGREADYERELRKLEWEARGLAAPPVIPERPLTAQEEFDKNVVTLPDGRKMFRRGAGKFDDLGGTTADPRAQLEIELNEARNRLIAARDRQHRAAVEAWKNGRRVDPYPQLPPPPTYDEIGDEAERHRNWIEGELQRRQGGGRPSPNQLPTPLPPTGRRPTVVFPDSDFNEQLPPHIEDDPSVAFNAPSPDLHAVELPSQIGNGVLWSGDEYAPHPELTTDVSSVAVPPQGPTGSPTSSVPSSVLRSADVVLGTQASGIVDPTKTTLSRESQPAPSHSPAADPAPPEPEAIWPDIVPPPPAAKPIALGSPGSVALSSLPEPKTEVEIVGRRLWKENDSQLAAAREYGHLFPGMLDGVLTIRNMLETQGHDPFKWKFTPEDEKRGENWNPDELLRLQAYQRTSQPNIFFDEFGDSPHRSPGTVYGPLLIAPGRHADLVEDRDGYLHVVATYGSSDEPPPKIKFSRNEIRKLNPVERVSDEERKRIEFGRNMAGAVSWARREFGGHEGGEWIIDRVPFVGFFYDGRLALEAIAAAKTLQEKWDKSGEFDSKAAHTVANFVLRHEKKAQNYDAKSNWGKAWDLITRLPGFAVEFGTTFGGAQVVKAGAKRLLGKTAIDAAQAAVKKGIIRRVGGKVLDATTTAMIQTPINAPRTVAATAGYMAPTIDENAQLKDGDDPSRAVTRAFVDGTIENLTESMGGMAVGKGAAATGRALGYTARKIVGDKAVDAAKAAVAKWSGAQKLDAMRKVVADHMAEKWPNFTPAEWLKKLAKKGGFHGPLGEYLEERYGEGMRAAADYVARLDLSHPGGVLNSLADSAGKALAGKHAEANTRLWNAIDQTLIEGGAFLIPGLAASGANAVMSRPTQPTPANQNPAVTAKDLGTRAGVARWAAENPEAAGSIVENSNPSRGFLAKVTGTSRNDWSNPSQRQAFVEAVSNELAEQRRQAPSRSSENARPPDPNDVSANSQQPQESRSPPAIPHARPAITQSTNQASAAPTNQTFANSPAARANNSQSSDTSRGQSRADIIPQSLLEQDGAIILRNGSRVPFAGGGGAKLADNGDILVSGEGNSPHRTIPASSVVRVDGPDGRTAWRPPPQVPSAKGGVAYLKNGSKITFESGALTEGGDIVVPEQVGKPAHTIPASKIARIETPERRTVLPRPPSMPSTQEPSVPGLGPPASVPPSNQPEGSGPPGQPIKRGPRPSKSTQPPLPPNIEAAVEEVWRRWGVDLTVSNAPLNKEQQIVVDFADWLAVTPAFVDVPGGGWFGGYGKNNVILLDARASGMDNLWYLGSHEIAHAIEIDKLKVPERVWRAWYDLYQAKYSKTDPYRLNYLNVLPEMHSREGLAHMFGTFMTMRRFRDLVAAIDRPLWHRMVAVILDWWRYAIPLPREAKKMLRELKKRRKQLRAEEAAGRRTPVGKPPPQ